VPRLFDLPLRLLWPTAPGAFRLFLAFIVVCGHYSSFDMGVYAVWVFFVLSGFWLHTMWVERYSGTRQPYLTYLVSRIWRLAPVMALVSLITIPLLLTIGLPRTTVFAANPLHLAVSSVFLLGYSWLEYQPVRPAWSLDVEMQFYVFAPLLSVLLLQGWKRLLLAAAAVLSMIGAAFVDVSILPKFGLFFMLGMIAAASDWHPSRRLALVSGLGVLAILLLVAFSPWSDLIWGGATPSAFHRTWNPPFAVALALLTVPFAMYTVRQKSDPPDRLMADLSYIVYLVHWMGVQWFARMAGRPFLDRFEVAALSVAATLVVSLAIWKFYDKPLNRARARWVSSRAVSKPPPQSDMDPVRYEPAGP